MSVLPFRHPLRRPSTDEMYARGLADIQDPDAVLPQVCSECRAPSSAKNPLRLVPVDRSPRALARAYLYRALCAFGCGASRRI